MKQFCIWITVDGDVQMGWVDPQLNPIQNARSEIKFDGVKKAAEWAKTYTGFGDSTVRSMLDRLIFDKELK